jgi:hypothetical protein
MAAIRFNAKDSENNRVRDDDRAQCDSQNHETDHGPSLDGAMPLCTARLSRLPQP